MERKNYTELKLFKVEMIKKKRAGHFSFLSTRILYASLSYCHTEAKDNNSPYFPYVLGSKKGGSSSKLVILFLTHRKKARPGGAAQSLHCAVAELRIQEKSMSN